MLTVLEGNPYESHSPVQAERLVWMAYEEGKRAQLAHDQKQIKGE